MNYYFKGALIVLFVLLCFFRSANSKSVFINDTNNILSTWYFYVSVEKRDSDYNYRQYSNTNDYNNYSDDRSVRLTWRHYLGSACTKEFREVQTENVQL